MWWEDLDTEDRPVLVVRLGRAVNEFTTKEQADTIAEVIISQVSSDEMMRSTVSLRQQGHTHAVQEPLFVPLHHGLGFCILNKECHTISEAHISTGHCVIQIDYGVTNFLSDAQGSAEKLVVVLDCRGATAFKVGLMAHNPLVNVFMSS